MRIAEKLCVATALVMAGCSGDTAVERVPSTAFSDPEQTPLGRIVADAADADNSGVLQLDNGRQAFDTRIFLADAATRSIDVQYYIWRSDDTGNELTSRLLEAANHGVRVRILLDDYGVDRHGNPVFALDAHENVEVRAYNPIATILRALWSGDLRLSELFARLNRRMHSKTFIVDESFAIAGGRNVGNEYFDAGLDMNFIDRELLVAGPVVTAISSQFDVMWNSEWSVPATAETPLPADANAEDPGVGADPLDRVRDWVAGMIWAPVEFAYNPPELTGGNEHPDSSVGKSLRGLMRAAQRELLIESSYFVVPDEDLEKLQRLLDRGLNIEVLTNSLASTDVWTIHSGYTRNRPDVIRSGVRLYEFRSDAASCAVLIVNPQLNCGNFKFSLHNKTIVFDREIVYIGSFNLNPRSELVNTETALIVHSPELAHLVAAEMRYNRHPENSWKVAINTAGELEWRGISDGEELVRKHEPDAGALLRFASWVYSAFAVDKYL